MKKINDIFLAAITALIISCSPQINTRTSTVPAPNSLRIMSYNIHHANPPSKPDVIDLDAIANVIKAQNPDVVGLQEIDRLTKRSGTLDEAKLLAEKTGLHYKFFRAIDYEGGEYGTMILSRFPISNAKNIPLPEAATLPGEDRVLAYVTVNMPNGKSFIFANTHMDAQRTNQTRTVQMKAILEELESKKGPVILCGDLNSIDTSEAIILLDKQFKRTCTQNCPGTVPQINPRSTIDYIAIKNSNWEVKSYQVIAETYASDHRPVVADFIIN